MTHRLCGWAYSGSALCRAGPAKESWVQLTAIVTLALTIGANTAVFSIVDALLIRPLPYPRANGSPWCPRNMNCPPCISSDQQSQDGEHELVRDHATAFDAAVYSDSTSRAV